MLLSYRNTYKTLDDLNQTEMKLGGLRINPVTNISSTVTYINNLKIRKLRTKTKFKLMDYLQMLELRMFLVQTKRKLHLQYY